MMKNPHIRIGISSGRLIPVSIDKAYPKLLSARVTKKNQEDVAKMAGFIAAAYDILIARWNRFLLSDYEALCLLLELAQRQSGRSASIRDYEILVLYVGDGAVLAIDHEIHQARDVDGAIWLGWNADVGSSPQSPEQWRQKAEQITENIIKDHNTAKCVVILAQMSGKPSTHMLLVSAKVFQEHGIWVFRVIADDHHSMTVKQQEIITRELRRRSDLLIFLPNTVEQDTPFLLWQVTRWLISGLKCRNPYHISDPTLK